MLATSKELQVIVRVIVAALLSMLAITSLSAQEQTPPVSVDKAVQAVANVESKQRESLPLWEAGVFGMGISHPAYPGAETQSSLAFALPFIIYRGDILRIDRGDVGVRALKTPRTEIDVGFAASLAARASAIPARRGMDDLGTLLEFGPRLKINLGDETLGRSDSRLQLPLRFVFDANDHLRYKGIAYELQWIRELWLAEKWRISSNLGAVWGDQDLVNTFYRVLPSEATPDRAAYTPTAGLISIRGSLLATKLLTPEWRVLGYFRVESVAAGINQDSPLIRKEVGWTVGLGMAYTLAQSERLSGN